MKCKYTTLEQVPLVLCIEEMAQLLGISRSHAYMLAHKAGCPVIYIGKRMAVKRDALFAWLEEQSQLSDL